MEGSPSQTTNTTIPSNEPNTQKTLDQILKEQEKHIDVVKGLKENFERWEAHLEKREADLEKSGQKLDKERQELQESKRAHQQNLSKYAEEEQNLKNKQRAFDKTQKEDTTRQAGLRAQFEEDRKALNALDAGLKEHAEDLAKEKADLEAKRAAQSEEFAERDEGLKRREAMLQLEVEEHKRKNEETCALQTQLKEREERLEQGESDLERKTARCRDELATQAQALWVKKAALTEQGNTLAAKESEYLQRDSQLRASQKQFLEEKKRFQERCNEKMKSFDEQKTAETKLSEFELMMEVYRGRAEELQRAEMLCTEREAKAKADQRETDRLAAELECARKALEERERLLAEAKRERDSAKLKLEEQVACAEEAKRSLTEAQKSVKAKADDLHEMENELADRERTWLEKTELWDQRQAQLGDEGMNFEDLIEEVEKKELVVAVLEEERSEGQDELLARLERANREARGLEEGRERELADLKKLQDEDAEEAEELEYARHYLGGLTRQRCLQSDDKEEDLKKKLTRLGEMEACWSDFSRLVDDRLGSTLRGKGVSDLPREPDSSLAALLSPAEGSEPSEGLIDERVVGRRRTVRERDASPEGDQDEEGSSPRKRQTTRRISAQTAARGPAHKRDRKRSETESESEEEDGEARTPKKKRSQPAK